MEVDKVIITNMDALREKYGAKMPRIEKAIGRLITADKKRGLETKLVAIDSANDMEVIRGHVVKDREDKKRTYQGTRCQFKLKVHHVWRNI